MEPVPRVPAVHILPHPPPTNACGAPADASICAERAGDRHILHPVKRDHAPAPRGMVVFESVDEQQCDHTRSEEGAGHRPDATWLERRDQAGEELFAVLGERGEGRGEIEGGGHEGRKERRIGARNRGLVVRVWSFGFFSPGIGSGSGSGSRGQG